MRTRRRAAFRFRKRARLAAALALAPIAWPLAIHVAPAAAFSYVVSVCEPYNGQAMPYSANDYVNIADGESCGSSNTGSGYGLQVWSSGSSTPAGHAGGYWFHAPAATSITYLKFSGDFAGWDGWSAHWSTRQNGSDYLGDTCEGYTELQAQILNSAGEVVEADTDNDWGPDFTAPAPCGQSGRGYTWSPAIGSLPNGLYYVQIVATNPSDWWNGQPGAVATIPVYVDNDPPPPVAGLNATSGGMGPLGWSSTPNFSLSWTGQPDYPGPQSPIITTNVSVAGGSSEQQSASQTTANVTVGSAAGGYSASVWEQDLAGNQASPQSVALYYDPSAPSAPSFGPDRPTWIGASQASVPEALSATAGGPSGVYGYSVSVDGQPSTDWHDANVKADGGGNGSFDVSSLADGVHQLCAVSAIRRSRQ